MEVNQIKQLRVGDIIRSTLTPSRYEVIKIIGHIKTKDGYYCRVKPLPGDGSWISSHLDALSLYYTTLALPTLVKETALQTFLAGMRLMSELPKMPAPKGNYNDDGKRPHKFKAGDYVKNWKGKTYLVSYTEPDGGMCIKNVDESEMVFVGALGVHKYEKADRGFREGDYVKSKNGSTYFVTYVSPSGRSLTLENVATLERIYVGQEEFYKFSHTPPPVTQRNPKYSDSELSKYPLTEKETYHTPVLDAIRQRPLTENECYSKADQEAKEKRIDPVYSSDKAADIAKYFKPDIDKRFRDAMLGKPLSSASKALLSDYFKTPYGMLKRVNKTELFRDAPYKITDEDGQFPLRFTGELKNRNELSASIGHVELFYLTNICLRIMDNLEVRKMVLNKLNIKDPGTDANH